MILSISPLLQLSFSLSFFLSISPLQLFLPISLSFTHFYNLAICCFSISLFLIHSLPLYFHLLLSEYLILSFYLSLNLSVNNSQFWFSSLFSLSLLSLRIYIALFTLFLSSACLHTPTSIWASPTALHSFPVSQHMSCQNLIHEEQKFYFSSPKP